MYLGVVITLCLCTTIMIQIFKHIIPEFITQSIDKLKANENLMSQIGGYDNYEAKFDKTSFNQGDTTNIELKILGYEKVLMINGKIIKKNEKWVTINTDTLIRDYE